MAKIDIKKNYLSKYPEFGPQIGVDTFATRGRVIGTDVLPEGPSRVVTFLEPKKVKEEKAALRAELGLDENLETIKEAPKHVPDSAGDAATYQYALENTGFLVSDFDEI